MGCFRRVIARASRTSGAVWSSRRAATCWVTVCCALFLGFPGPLGRAAQQPAPPPVVDLHVDLSYQVNFEGQPADRGTGQYDVRWLKQSGVSGVVLPLYVPRDASPQGPQMRHLEQSREALLPVLPTIGYSADLCAGRVGAPGVQFAFEGAEPVGWELSSVARWSKRGVRLFGLVHSYDNALASSSGHGGRPRDYGLSRRGAELVRRIHRYEGMVDISHASDEAVAQIIDQALAAGHPVVATHSNARALAPHPRNLTDAQLRAVASTGGVVGINFHSRFLLGTAGTASLDDVVRHVLHAVRVAGADHVAIGSDFEGGINPPKKLADIRGFPKLANALQTAGLSRTDVEKVFAINAQRVLCRGAGRPAW